ncbi:MAG: XdhC family protein [Cyclobacteriaceae bacterium]|nr:XdhC family protein [Cyclobacteriaceae bacterium]
MTHELRNIFESDALAQKQGLKTVLATVVDLEGSSYRKPGVRMLIWENGFMLGAVSGGCVEKEILKQSGSVFKTGVAKIMTYDGRYRLGCEGIIYILIEKFNPVLSTVEYFYNLLATRTPFKLVSHYAKSPGESTCFGSAISHINGSILSFSGGFFNTDEADTTFIQVLNPCNRIIILGAEHDSVELCKLAHFSGWEVIIVCSISNPKTTNDFPEAKEVLALQPASIKGLMVDEQTAVVLMSHNYATDLNHLLAIKDQSPIYIGILGAKKRKEKLLDEFIVLHPEVEEAFLEKIHGPAGLNVGAITPQEIAISIMAEMMAVMRSKNLALISKSVEVYSS